MPLFTSALMRRLVWAGLLSCLHSYPVQAAPIDLPDIPQCTELLPGAIATDFAPVSLNLRVVLDGVSQNQAATLVSSALTAYAPLGISFNVSYQNAGFSNRDGLALLEEVKQFYGGNRPAGTHLVYVLTSKNLTDGSVFGDSLAGQADCIGGVAFAGNAFAVGEFDPEVGAKTLAHELGHLFGGQHHYANCAESLALGGDNLCTLMFNDVGFASLLFSTLNGLVVSGHAQLAGVAAPTSNPSTGNSGGNPASSGSGGGSLGWLSLVALATLCACRRRPALLSN